MTSTKFKKYLKEYIQPFVRYPVVVEETNSDRELPCIIITVDSEENANNGMPCHYELEGQVICAVHSRDDDEQNTTLIEMGEKVLEALADNCSLMESMNQETNFKLLGTIINGTTVMQEEATSFYTIGFEAFTYYSIA